MVKKVIKKTSTKKASHKKVQTKVSEKKVCEKKMSMFEVHPKTTMFIILVLLLTIIVFWAEIILSKTKAPKINWAYRHVRLSEHPPGRYLRDIPSKSYLETTDTLEVKDYILDVDNNGFIKPSIVHENPDLTMVFLWGSTTEALYVDEDKRFPYLVWRKLEEKLWIKINSINAWRSGNHTLSTINVIQNKIVALQPNIVVVKHNFNDLSTLLHEKSYYTPWYGRTPIINEKWWMYYFLRDVKSNVIPNLFWVVDQAVKFEKLAAFLWLSWGSDEFANTRWKKIEFDEDELVKKFTWNLQTIIDICKNNWIIPVLMTQWNRMTEHPDKKVSKGLIRSLNASWIEYKDFRHLNTVFNDTIERVAEKNGIIAVDLANSVPKTKKYIYDIVHYNSTWSMVAADVITWDLFPLVESLSLELNWE